MYKCKKQVLLLEGTKSVCDWHGPVEGFIAHFRRSHPQNFFYLNENNNNSSNTFKWRLPIIGNQCDIGVLQYAHQYYLYEILYSRRAQKLQFSMLYFGNEINAKLRYTIVLHKDDDYKEFDGLVNVNNFDKNDYYHSFNINISFETLYNYLNEENEVVWHLDIH